MGMCEIRDPAAAIADSGAVAELLAALYDISGMGFAVVAEVSAESWTARAVLDRVNLGVVNGSRLDLSTTLCREVRNTRRAIVIDHATVDARYADHPTPKLYGFESYISVPIVLASTAYFGNLCALHTRPVRVSDPRIQLMFHCHARLIALHIDARATRGKKQVDPLNQHIVGNLRSLFVALMAHAEPERDPALRQLAARAATQGHRLCSLVNDVLAYARGRLNGGMPGYIWKVDDLNDRLRGVVADTLAANPNRVIITNIAFDEPVDCDPALIQALATNLLNNALAHGAPTGPVSFIASTRDNDLEIAVWHQGNVITDRRAARRELLNCAKIVRAHLGTIGVTSSPTEGTQFVARIPVVRSLRLH
jgi:hypothetical protein